MLPAPPVGGVLWAQIRQRERQQLEKERKAMTPPDLQWITLDPPLPWYIAPSSEQEPKMPPDEDFYERAKTELGLDMPALHKQLAETDQFADLDQAKADMLAAGKTILSVKTALEYMRANPANYPAYALRQSLVAQIDHFYEWLDLQPEYVEYEAKLERWQAQNAPDSFLSRGLAKPGMLLQIEGECRPMMLGGIAGDEIRKTDLGWYGAEPATISAYAVLSLPETTPAFEKRIHDVVKEAQEVSAQAKKTAEEILHPFDIDSLPKTRSGPFTAEADAPQAAERREARRLMSESSTGFRVKRAESIPMENGVETTVYDTYEEWQNLIRSAAQDTNNFSVVITEQMKQVHFVFEKDAWIVRLPRDKWKNCSLNAAQYDEWKRLLTVELNDIYANYRAPVQDIENITYFFNSLAARIKTGEIVGIRPQDAPKRLALGYLVDYADGTKKWFQIRIKKFKNHAALQDRSAWDPDLKTEYERQLLGETPKDRMLNTLLCLIARKQSGEFKTDKPGYAENLSDFLTQVQNMAKQQKLVDLYWTHGHEGLCVVFESQPVWIHDDSMSRDSTLHNDLGLNALRTACQLWYEEAHGPPPAQKTQENLTEPDWSTALACLGISAALALLMNKKAPATETQPITVEAQEPAYAVS